MTFYIMNTFQAVKPGSLQDKFRGCLAGLAIGDAFGNPVEGWTHNEIQSLYTYLETYEPNYDEAGIATDDTQLAMLTAQSIIERNGVYTDHLLKLYFDWIAKADTFGMGIQSALARHAKGISFHDCPSDSPGNGAAMRIAPIALFHYGEQNTLLLDESVKACAYITHKNPLSIAGSVAVASAIQYALSHQEIESSEFLNYLVAKTRSHSQEFASCVTSIKTNEVSPEWVFPDSRVQVSIPFSIHSFLKHPKHVKSTLEYVVNKGGDTDTNASIAGSFVGALNGYSSFPSYLVKNYADKKYTMEKILEIADTLFSMVEKRGKP
jgi:ADP-ribosylglycohydrolase